MVSCAAETGPEARSSGEKAILDAAVELFSRHGFDGVSMRAIALEAGVSKSNIYHHFASKDDLYLAIMQASAVRLGELVDELAEGAGNFEQRLRVFARAHLEHLFENAMTARLLLREVMSGEEKWRRLLVDKVVGGIFEHLQEIFENGQREGHLRPGLDPGLCAMQILGGNLHYFQSYKMLHLFPNVAFALEHDRYSESMMDIIVNGMLAQPEAGK